MSGPLVTWNHHDLNQWQKPSILQNNDRIWDKLAAMNIEQMVTELFDLFDVNQDGVISRGEFVSLAEALLHEKGLNFSSDIFKKFDVNHDNKISRDELINLVQELAL
jgi:Ca2+-binding EF-hand superfamily protein